jgi:hypothetical protein
MDDLKANWFYILAGLATGYILIPKIFGESSLGAIGYDPSKWRRRIGVPQGLLSGGSTGWNPNFGYWRPKGYYSIGGLRGGAMSIPPNLFPFGTKYLQVKRYF